MLAGNEDDEPWASTARGRGSPSRGARAPSPQQQQQQQPGRAGKGSRLWVLDGRIYNYKKEGATEVSGQGQAQQLVQQAQEVAQQIHGLGAGGNVPSSQQQQQAPAGDLPCCWIHN